MEKSQLKRRMRIAGKILECQRTQSSGNLPNFDISELELNQLQDAVDICRKLLTHETNERYLRMKRSKLGERDAYHRDFYDLDNYAYRAKQNIGRLLDWYPNRTNRSKPTLMNIFHDVCALEAQFNAEIDAREKTIKLESGKVTLEDENGDDVELGNYPIIISYNGKISYEIERPDNANESIDGHYHPHIDRDGSLCFGNLEAPLSAAISDARVYDVAQLLFDFCHCYNPYSPFRKLKHWHFNPVNCCSCHAEIDREESIQDGRHFYCREHSFYCDICEEDRGDRISRFEIGEQTACARCHFVCNTCEKPMPIEKINNNGYETLPHCYSCGNYTCSDCGTLQHCRGEIYNICGTYNCVSTFCREWSRDVTEWTAEEIDEMYQNSQWETAIESE